MNLFDWLWIGEKSMSHLKDELVWIRIFKNLFTSLFLRRWMIELSHLVQISKRRLFWRIKTQQTSFSDTKWRLCKSVTHWKWQLHDYDGKLNLQIQCLSFSSPVIWTMELSIMCLENWTKEEGLAGLGSLCLFIHWSCFYGFELELLSTWVAVSSTCLNVLKCAHVKCLGRSICFLSVSV